VAEIVALGLLNGNGPGYYLAAGFYRREIPWPDKRLHLGQKSYRRRLARINPEPFRAITQVKLVEKSLLAGLGFPTPTFLGFLHPERGRTAAAERLNEPAHLATLLASCRGERVVFKLVEGWAGRGFIVADIDPDGRGVRVVGSRHGQVETVSAEVLYAALLDGEGSGGRLIEAYFHQHPAMAAFNPSSVNTCRIWVAEEEPGSPRVVLAYVRVGREGSLVDNQSAGGIVAPIDLDTGVTRAAIDGRPERNTFERHPDHGGVIAGQPVPFWREAKALAEEAVRVLPGLRFAGVDVAIGPDGPAIIELNASPDREGAAFVGIASGRVVPDR
jgi:hypothetical protein